MFIQLDSVLLEDRTHIFHSPLNLFHVRHAAGDK